MPFRLKVGLNINVNVKFVGSHSVTHKMNK